MKVKTKHTFKAWSADGKRVVGCSTTDNIETWDEQICPVCNSVTVFDYAGEGFYVCSECNVIRDDNKLDTTSKLEQGQRLC